MKQVVLTSAFPATVQPGIPKLGAQPTGWMRFPLGDLLHEVRRPIKMVDDVKYRLVTVKRARGGVVERDVLRGGEISVKSQFEIEPGDFLISKRQIVHGACGLVPDELAGSIVSNEYAVLNGNDEIDLRFLNYLAHSVFFQQTCFHSSIGVHIEKMIFKLDRWLRWEFDLPPLSEQRKIAEVLGTWDQAIEVAKQQLETARTQKHALMQQLLTGKRRFPEFQDRPWEEVRLRTLTTKIGSGVTPKGGRNSYLDRGVPLIRSQNVGWGQMLMRDVAYISVEQHDLMSGSKVKKHDVLLNITGASIGRSAVYIGQDEGANVNQHVCIIRAEDHVEPRFLNAFLLSNAGQKQVDQFQAGGNRQGLNFEQIGSFRVPALSLVEQRKIADALSIADNAIGEASSSVQKLRTEKKALMQQLLTGKRRVTV